MRDYLQKKLLLEGYIINYDYDVKKGNIGQCDTEKGSKVARISLDKNLKGELLKQTVIHEMLHIHTTPIRDTEWIRKITKKSVYETIDKRIFNQEERLVCTLEDVVYNILYNKK